MRVFSMLRKYQRRTAGPGRPRKYPEGIKFFGANIAGSTYDRLYALKERLGVPFSELLTWLVDLAEGKIDKLKLLAKTRHQEEYIKQLEKEKQALLEEREKLLDRIEKLEFKLATYEKGRFAVTSRASKIIKALAKAFEEGKTWAQVCEEVGIATPQEQIKLLHEFFMTRDDKGKVMDVIRPLKTVKAFRGWVLVKGNAENVVDYVLEREDTLKVAKSLKKVKPEAVKEKVISIEQAKKELRERFLNAYLTYQKFLEAGKEKEALKFLHDVQDGLERLVEKYGLDLVEDVVNEDFRFVELFGSLLSALKASKKKKPVEVKA